MSFRVPLRVVCGWVWLSRGLVIVPLLLRVSRSPGWSPAVLFLAEEHAIHLHPRTARRHLPDTQRNPSSESPLDYLRTHQSDDRLAIFGYG